MGRREANLQEKSTVRYKVLTGNTPQPVYLQLNATVEPFAKYITQNKLYKPTQNGARALQQDNKKMEEGENAKKKKKERKKERKKEKKRKEKKRKEKRKEKKKERNIYGLPWKLTSVYCHTELQLTAKRQCPLSSTSLCSQVIFNTKMG
jgi:hypothetical protein